MTPTAEQALQALEIVERAEHVYLGLCPDAHTPNSRDQKCLACQAGATIRQHIEATAAELEALRKDAARYRGLRDNPDVDPGHLLFWQTEEDRALIDERVDAALNQGGAG